MREPSRGGNRPTVMRQKVLALGAAISILLTACGEPGDAGGGDSPDPDAPVIQIRFEGGFLPVEMSLAQGPRYTMLGDGRLIYEGPVILIYPGPLLPNYQVIRLDDETVDQILDLVEAMGLSAIDREIDDSAMEFIADAATEVITYWDEAGEHVYGVYALDVVGDTTPQAATFLEIVELIDRAVGTEPAEPYEPERVRVIAGPGFVDEEFRQIMDWPLEDTDLSGWTALAMDWRCRAFDNPEILDAFMDANQATQWRLPGSTGDNEALTLLVRPLHPGEPDCPAA